MRYGQNARYNAKYNVGNLAEKLPQQPQSTPVRKETIKQNSQQGRKLLRRRIIALALTVIAFAFTMVMRSNVLVTSGSHLVGLRQSEAEIIKQNDLLRLDVNKLNSPERINTLAKSMLGMTIAKQNIYINKVNKQN